MLDWIKDIPGVEQNLVCGAIGAILIVFYQIYNSMPDIEAILTQNVEVNNSSHIFSKTLILVFKISISVGCASIVAAFLVRPQETYGAIITGMTWTSVVKNLIQVKK